MAFSAAVVVSTPLFFAGTVAAALALTLGGMLLVVAGAKALIHVVPGDPQTEARLRARIAEALDEPWDTPAATAACRCVRNGPGGTVRMALLHRLSGGRALHRGFWPGEQSASHLVDRRQPVRLRGDVRRRRRPRGPAGTGRPRAGRAHRHRRALAGLLPARLVAARGGAAGPWTWLLFSAIPLMLLGYGGLRIFGPLLWVELALRRGDYEAAIRRGARLTELIPGDVSVAYLRYVALLHREPARRGRARDPRRHRHARAARRAGEPRHAGDSAGKLGQGPRRAR